MTDQKHTASTEDRRDARRRRRRLVAAIICLAVVLIAAVAGLFGWNHYDYRFGKTFKRSGTVKVTPGMTYEELNEVLIDSGYLLKPGKWHKYARSFGMDSIRPGNYTFSPDMSYRTALTNLRYGRQTPVRLTFNSVRSLERLAGAVSKYIAADSLDILLALKNEETIRDLGFTPATFPAMFIPNTYEVYWTLTPDQFIARMKKEYDRFWNEDRMAKAQKLGYTPVEISTIASIVSEETAVQREMPDVAGVYINRLRTGMALQADPTLKYAWNDPSIRRVVDRHKTIESPYNTYKYAGLPPGPICIPPVQAIDATLAYADDDKRHNYYYFCANPDFSGTHVFARTLPEHNRNAAAYHQELNRRGIR